MENPTNRYEELSYERKQLQFDGKAPKWLTTAGYQLLTEKKYLDTGETPIDMYSRIARRADELTSMPIPEEYGYDNWYEAFFDVMWKGWLSPSTPVLTNMGNNRGHPVSCSGSYVDDSIESFYKARRELAQLTQRGYGTSVCLDPIRHRGAPISKGGTANGVMQFASGVVQDMHDVSQGNSRRGSCGIYINPLHKDADEIIDQIIADDDGWNIGWNIGDEFNELFYKDPEKADYIWKRMLRAKLIKGKGYFFFIDKVNRRRPQAYKDHNVFVRHSNLCSEIHLFNDDENTFTCVLSSLNVSKYDEWKDTYLPQIAMVFLDAVTEDMLIKAKQETGFGRVISFMEKTRPVGLGVLGLSTYYQDKRWVFGDLQSRMFNQMLFREINLKTLEASKLLAKYHGEPEWLKGYGERFSHRLALPPTMSTSIVQGGVSQGIEPVFANVYEQDTAGGTVYRINPSFLKLMKDRGMYTVEVMERIAQDQGSVQGEDWLTDEEKAVFRTAFEINQEVILAMAADRQKNVDQGQSLNLYFTADEDEEEIARLHHLAFKDENILGLYYVRTLNGALKVTPNKSVCEACEG